MARRNPRSPLKAGSFEETFSKGVLDPTKWTISTGGAPGNNATNTGTFSSSNVDLSLGMLRLKLDQTGTAGVSVTSSGGEISTVSSFGYGTYEWVARMSSTSATPNGTGNNVSGTISGLFNYGPSSITEIDFELEGLDDRKNLLEMTSWKYAGIEYVGGVTGTTSATLPTHLKNDVILVFAYRSNSATAPTVPSGWTTIATMNGTTTSVVACWRRATDGTTTSGTWTNATDVVFEVYRGVTQDYNPIGGYTVNTASSSTATYSAITLIDTPAATWQSPWAVAFGASAVSSSIQNAPTGMTMRHNRTSTGEIASFDTTDGIESWSSQNVSLGGTSRWQTIVIELRRQLNQSTLVDGQADLYKYFNTYKFVWTSTGITYYLNNVLKATHTTVVPSTASPVFINHWGTDNVNFGGVATPSTPRYLYISYFKFTPE